MRKQRSFLICPVRGIDTALWEGVLKKLEEDGYTVHFPPRDTDQTDDTGYRICTINRVAIKSADIIDFIWDGKSQGCLFDLGMAFAMNKKIRIHVLPDPTNGKSFQNMVRRWEELQK